MKYRKIPMIVDVWLYNHDLDVSQFSTVRHCVGTHGHIDTLEGEMQIQEGDYLIRGIKGEFWAVKPDIFELTYEKIES